MAEDKVEPREVNWRQLLPWTLLFQGFRVALDPNKLVLAAAGILAMAFGWWLLAVIFDTRQKPGLSDTDLAAYTDSNDRNTERWKHFQAERAKWSVMHHAAGTEFPDANEREQYAYDAGDLADSLPEYDNLNGAAGKTPVVIPGLALPDHPLSQREVEGLIKAAQAEQQRIEVEVKEPREGEKVGDKVSRLVPVTAFDAKVWVIQRKLLRPAGQMRTLPWDENRGPNPFMLVTNQAGTQWDQGHFWDWLLLKQLPVLIEPLVKLLSPVIYFFSPKAGFLVRFYALLVMVWTLAVWGFFGGAITRIAVVQVARQEKIGLMEAVRFAARKYLSYLSAPLFPLVLVGILLVLMFVFGYLQMIPGFGDIIVDGLLWGLMILIGVAMAVVLVGLVGWPLMAATISAEGTDAWEAVSRSYSYVYQAPWQYIWYSLVALAYGAVIVFFIGIMGSLTVYLSKWGVSQTPGLGWKDRTPTFLFVYAPQSFGWRTLLLQDDTHNLVTKAGTINDTSYDAYVASMKWYNTFGAVLVSVVWVGAVFMLVLGFGYSYFWSASSIIYLLMRRKVDDAELDEVYLEEEDEASYAGPLASKPAPPPPAATPATGRPSLPIVEAPRPTAVSVAPPGLSPAPPAPEREEIAGAIHAAPVVPAAPPGPDGPAPGPGGNPPAGT